MSFTGDLICKLPQLKVAKKGDSFDFSPVFYKIAPLFDKSDYVCGNLETPIAGAELGYTSSASNFNTPIEFVEAAREAGFSFFSLANNHCLDRGLQGLFNTIDSLIKCNLAFTGCYKERSSSEFPFIVTVEGIKVAILSYTYGTNSQWLNNELADDERDLVDLFRKQDNYIPRSHGAFTSALSPLKPLIKKILPQSLREKIRPIVINDCVDSPDLLPEDEYYDHRLQNKIRIAKENADIVIMYMHSGGQFNSAVGKYTKNLAHRLVEYGCDVVVGSHPHCVLNFEQYRGSFVFYSLGNFCYTPSYGYHYDGVYSDYSAVLHLYLDTISKGLERVSLSITKTVLMDDGNSVVFPLSQLIQSASGTQRQQLIYDYQSVIRRFFGRDVDVDYGETEIDVITI